jgi:alpha-amylase/alpha-mannosidase (GH57 family)
MQDNKLNVVLCWHMHQPQYRSEGIYTRPWTWLHAIKDYSDMAAHVETVPGARAVVNFSPHLMVQIEDYAQLIRRFLDHGKPIGDRILDALGGEYPVAADEKEALLKSCLRSHDINMRQRFKPYEQLCQKTEQALEAGAPLTNQDRSDLLVWYGLSWMGEFIRRESPVVRRLTEQSHGFTQRDQRELLALIGDEIAGLLPRYRKLAEQGKIELSITPWSHPILPLLLDFESARESMPDVALPGDSYPGGEDRCNWHLRHAIEYFEQHFGMRPAGCWPSEGGLSQPTLDLLMQHGFRWTASGTNVLRNSLGDAYRNGSNQHQLWSAPPRSGNRQSGGADRPGVACIFRDDELSDLPGFSYSNWRAEDAVNDLLHRLEQILAHSSSEHTTVSIIMDGENAWEYYPENGREFLTTLYTRLAGHPHFRLSTFSELLEAVPRKPLPRLVAGSWVYGTFSVWIGHPAKNRAWELLIDAKKAVDRALESGLKNSLPVEQILEQLSVCESSDWFWWLGEEGRAEDGPAFDELFRIQLKLLYRLIGKPPPDVLDQPIDDTHALSADGDAAGTMRQANQPGL